MDRPRDLRAATREAEAIGVPTVDQDRPAMRTARAHRVASDRRTPTALRRIRPTAKVAATIDPASTISAADIKGPALDSTARHGIGRTPATIMPAATAVDGASVREAVPDSPVTQALTVRASQAMPATTGTDTINAATINTGTTPRIDPDTTIATGITLAAVLTVNGTATTPPVDTGITIDMGTTDTTPPAIPTGMETDTAPRATIDTMAITTIISPVGVTTITATARTIMVRTAMVRTAMVRRGATAMTIN